MKAGKRDRKKQSEIGEKDIERDRKLGRARERCLRK